MTTMLGNRLLQDRFESPVHAAVLNLLVAAEHIHEHLGRLLEPHDLTPTQYNVLRILKGAHPGGHPRCEIARRMIERAPDLTRMIDRLERRGLVERARSGEDRRHSITRITRRGLELVERVAPSVAALHRTVAQRLSGSEAVTLSRLCQRLYAED
jgi:DNA-binding MarR family transcriptional regulator